MKLMMKHTHGSFFRDDMDSIVFCSITLKRIFRLPGGKKYITVVMSGGKVRGAKECTLIPNMSRVHIKDNTYALCTSTYHALWKMFKDEPFYVKVS